MHKLATHVQKVITADTWIQDKHIMNRITGQIKY